MLYFILSIFFGIASIHVSIEGQEKMGWLFCAIAAASLAVLLLEVKE